MAIYRSQVVTIGSSKTYDKRKVFFIAGENTNEVVEFVTRSYLNDICDWRGRGNMKYVLLPSWVQTLPSISVIEEVRISEFDRRVCSKGGGIPHVDEQIKLFKDG